MGGLLPYLYFGYGSNMWKEQMKNRCKNSKFAGIGVYPGWKWIINSRGYATIVPSSGDEVYGLLYEMTLDDEMALDGYEVGYEKGKVDIIKVDKSKTTAVALVYIDKLTTVGVPKEEYIVRMNYAIADALKENVPDDYIQTYLRKFIPSNTDLN